MSDVGGRVWSAVAKATHAMPNRDTVSYEEWLATGDALASEAADDILRIIREALLSDAAVEAGAREAAFVGIEHVYRDRDAAWRDADAEEKSQFRAEYCAGVTAALDAAGIGEDNDE